MIGSLCDSNAVMKVLILDDDWLALGAARRALRECKVYAAQDSTSAVRLAKSCQPDVCVVDAYLSAGDDGMDAVKQILRAAPLTAVIVITASPSNSLRERVFSAGAHGYVEKADLPKMQEIVDYVLYVLRARRAASLPL